MYCHMKFFVLLVILLAGCAESKIDSCLDSGGSFNYDKCECDFNESHKFEEIHIC